MAQQPNRIRIPGKVADSIIAHARSRDEHNRMAQQEDMAVLDLINSARTLMGLGDKYNAVGEGSSIFFVRDDIPRAGNENVEVQVSESAASRSMAPSVVEEVVEAEPLAMATAETSTEKEMYKMVLPGENGAIGHPG